MKVGFTFRHMKQSEAVIAYTEEKIHKLFKLEMKPSWAEVVVGVQRHLKQVEIKVVGKDMRFVATAEHIDIHQAVDEAIDKIARQMYKKKSKVQNHKHARRTKEYMLKHFTAPSLITTFHSGSRKRAA
jgi:ribosomal subunit interface protein